jgi:hypothetical protein
VSKNEEKMGNMLRIMTIFVFWRIGGHDGDEERRGKRKRKEAVAKGEDSL